MWEGRTTIPAHYQQLLGGRDSSVSPLKKNLICREPGWRVGASYSSPGSERTVVTAQTRTEHDWCALRTSVQLGVAGGRMH